MSETTSTSVGRSTGYSSATATSIFSTVHKNKGPLALGILCGIVVAIIVIIAYNISTAVSKVPPFPELSRSQKNALIANTKGFQIIDKEVGTITVKEVRPVSTKKPRLDILLLHGSKFNIRIWVDLETIYHLANWGYRAVAINLHSSRAREETIQKVVEKAEMKNVVIISPSYSGSWSLPYLFNNPETSTDRAKLFIPVAPTGTNDYIEKFKRSQLPALIVYGEYDCCSNRLRNLPNHEISVIPNAGHQCYVDNPDYWHEVLYTKLKEF